MRRLEQLRRERGLRQTELAKILDMPRATISMLEADWPVGPTKRQTLADYFGEPFEKLMGPAEE